MSVFNYYLQYKLDFKKDYFLYQIWLLALLIWILTACGIHSDIGLKKMVFNPLPTSNGWNQPIYEYNSW